MVIIRINGRISPQQAEVVTEAIHMQAASGVIVVPHFCELLNEVPAGEEIQIIHQDTRVAELEEQLAKAQKKAHDTRERLCRYCRNADAPASQSSCWACDSGELFHLKGGGV